MYLCCKTDRLDTAFFALHLTAASVAQTEARVAYSATCMPKALPGGRSIHLTHRDRRPSQRLHGPTQLSSIFPSVPLGNIGSVLKRALSQLGLMTALCLLLWCWYKTHTVRGCDPQRQVSLCMVLLLAVLLCFKRPKRSQCVRHTWGCCYAVT